MRKWNWNSFQDILFVSFPFGTSQQDTILVLSSESKVYCRTRGRSGRAKGAKTKSGVKRRWQPRLGLLWGVLPAHGCLVCLHTFFSPTWSDKNCARIWFCSVLDKSNSAIDGNQYLLVGFEISWSVLVMDPKKTKSVLFCFNITCSQTQVSKSSALCPASFAICSWTLQSFQQGILKKSIESTF